MGVMEGGYLVDDKTKALTDDYHTTGSRDANEQILLPGFPQPDFYSAHFNLHQCISSFCATSGYIPLYRCFSLLSVFCVTIMLGPPRLSLKGDQKNK